MLDNIQVKIRLNFAVGTQKKSIFHFLHFHFLHQPPEDGTLCVAGLSLGGWGAIRAPVSLIHEGMEGGGGAGGVLLSSRSEYLLMALWV